jgi:hypothetical protein
MMTDEAKMSALRLLSMCIQANPFVACSGGFLIKRKAK